MHEYAHALHAAFAGSHWKIDWLPWMVEGIAIYFDVLIWGGWRSHYGSYEAYFQKEVIPKMRDRNAKYRTAPPATSPSWEPNRILSLMAVAHLVELVGEQVFLDGLDEAPDLTDPRWHDEPDAAAVYKAFARGQEEAFKGAFGITPEELLCIVRATPCEFWTTTPGRHRKDRQPGGPTCRRHQNHFGSQHTFGVAPGHITGAEGTFTMTFLHGHGQYRLFLRHNSAEGPPPVYRNYWVACQIEFDSDHDVRGVVINLADRPESERPEDLSPAVVPDCAESPALH